MGNRGQILLTVTLSNGARVVWNRGQDADCDSILTRGVVLEEDGLLTGGQVGGVSGLGRGLTGVRALGRVMAKAVAAEALGCAELRVLALVRPSPAVVARGLSAGKAPALSCSVSSDVAVSAPGYVGGPAVLRRGGSRCEGTGCSRVERCGQLSRVPGVVGADAVLDGVIAEVRSI